MEKEKTIFTNGPWFIGTSGTVINMGGERNDLQIEFDPNEIRKIIILLAKEAVMLENKLGMPNVNIKVPTVGL